MLLKLGDIVFVVSGVLSRLGQGDDQRLDSGADAGGGFWLVRRRNAGDLYLHITQYRSMLHIWRKSIIRQVEYSLLI
ncbi:hypothetical protein AB0F25_27005 [Streptomyces wedmorensis]|uniref:hypothetical protein n=1 Tax=Streptomyces wedmorensis TaxID=43759 RepID=UPI00342A0BBB